MTQDKKSVKKGILGRLIDVAGKKFGELDDELAKQRRIEHDKAERLKERKEQEGVQAAEHVGTERIDREEGYLYYVGQDGYKWRVPMRTNPSGEKGKVGTEKIKREDGYLYFIDKNGYVMRTKLTVRVTTGSNISAVHDRPKAGVQKMPEPENDYNELFEEVKKRKKKDKKAERE